MNTPTKQQPDTIIEQFNLRVREKMPSAAAAVLREHPDSTLGDLVDHLATASPALRSVTIGELLAIVSGPRSDVELRGPDFDAAVLQTLADHEQLMREAGVRFMCGMSSAELVARVGGPRWKLQASMRRLVGAGKVSRSGITSGTRYSLVGGVALA